MGYGVDPPVGAVVPEDDDEVLLPADVPPMGPVGPVGAAAACSCLLLPVVRYRKYLSPKIQETQGIQRSSYFSPKIQEILKS